MTIRLSIAAALLAGAAPAIAATHSIVPGDGAQEALQEALILAEPGDEIVLAAGRYTLTDGLSLDVDDVTVRGAGMDGTVTVDRRCAVCMRGAGHCRHAFYCAGGRRAGSPAGSADPCRTG